MRTTWKAAAAACALTIIPWTSVPVASAPVDYGEMCLGVSATPNPVVSGRTVNITGRNAVPRTTVRVWLGSTEVRTKARGLGAFSASLPAPTKAGAYTLSVRARCDLPGFPVRVVQNLVITVSAPQALPAPGAPRNVKASIAGAPDREGRPLVTISWAAPNTGGAPSSYIVRFRKNGVEKFTTLTTSTTRSITERVPIKKWKNLTFVVVASNKAGASNPSAPFTLSKN